MGVCPRGLSVFCGDFIFGLILREGIFEQTWVVLFAASSAAVQRLTNRVVQYLHLKARTGLWWWRWVSSQSMFQLPQTVGPRGGRLRNEAEKHKLLTQVCFFLALSHRGNETSDGREELRLPRSGRPTVSVWVSGKISWRFQRKPEPLRFVGLRKVFYSFRVCSRKIFSTQPSSASDWNTWHLSHQVIPDTESSC